MVVSGSRADWGLLQWIVDGLERADAVSLQLVVTGMHLVEEFGNTVDAIVDLGMRIDARVPTIYDDSPVGIAQSIGAGVAGFAAVISRLQPDLLIVLGDRYEIFAAAQAAMCSNVPIAHIAGGDSTEGAFDEAIRHSVTKMSHLHFVTNAEAFERVVQLGENPDHVFLVGSPGIDYILRAELLDRATLTDRLGQPFRERNALVTFHPITLRPSEGLIQLQELLAALDALGDDFGIFFTLANADTFGSQLRERVLAFVGDHPNAKAYASLGQQGYLSLLAQVDVVVGNSSSGLYEAPTLRTPTVNVGDRQAGRMRASSVIDVAADRIAIGEAIERALVLDVSRVVNPYGSGGAVEKIVKIVADFGDFGPLLSKNFHRVTGHAS